LTDRAIAERAGEQGEWIRAVKRRNFIKAGLGGAAALAATRKSQSAPSLPSARGIIVIGVEGGDLTVPYLDDYLNTGVTVWQYSGNTIDFDRFDKIQNFVDANAPKITLAKSYKDIVAAKQAGMVALVVGAQDLYPLEPEWQADRDPPPNNWAVDPPMTQLSNYYDRGLRIANLSYNLSSFFGGGCLDPTTPLSRAGQFIVGQMQELGILVDCSHSSEQTSLDVVRMATRPVVCSHSNPVGIDDNPRNISDELIEGIAKTGGLIGLNATNAFLLWRRADAPKADTGPFPPLASISQYVDAIDYVARLVGTDHIGIGPDWTIGNPPSPETLPLPSKSFLFPPEMAYYEPAGIDYVENFNQVSDLPVLVAELKRHGYSPVDRAKILGGNWMRVFRQAWNS
jgi:membrane dipeptidase